MTILSIRILAHAALCVCLTVYVVKKNSIQATYIRSGKRLWDFLFRKEKFLFTRKDFVTALDDSLTTYLNLDKHSLTPIQYRQDATSISCVDQPSPVDIALFTWKDSSTLSSTHLSISSPFKINGTLLTPETLTIFDSMKVDFTLCGFLSSPEEYTSCYLWDIHIYYNFISQLYVLVDVDSRVVGMCNENKEFLVHKTMWLLNMLLLVLSLFYTCVLLYAIWQSYCDYILVKQAHQRATLKLKSNEAEDNKTKNPLFMHKVENDRSECGGGSSSSSSSDRFTSRSRSRSSKIQPSHASPLPQNMSILKMDWQEIPISVRLTLINLWLPASLVGALLIVSMSSLNIRDDGFNSGDLVNYLAAAGSFFVYATILQFFERFESINATIKIFFQAITGILEYSVGVVPIFMALVFFAMSAFGYRLTYFSTLAYASFSSFSIMNGDSIFLFHSQLSAESPILANIYIISLTFITAYLVLNVLIALIDDIYFICMKRDRYLTHLIQKGIGLKNEGGNDTHTSPLSNTHSNQNEMNDLVITEAEESAEIYILGSEHWRYSKMVDYLASVLQGDEYDNN